MKRRSMKQKALSALVASSMLFSAFSMTSTSVLADIDFSGTVTTPAYIEAEGDTYDYMYEFTVPDTATAEEWYSSDVIKISLDVNYKYNITVKEFCQTGTSTERGIYFLMKNGATNAIIVSGNHGQGTVMENGNSNVLTFQNIGNLTSLLLQSKIIKFTAGSVLRTGVSLTPAAYKVTVEDDVTLFDGADSDGFVKPDTSFSYIYQGEQYQVESISGPVTINASNAATFGTKTELTFYHVSAGEGVTLVNVPTDGYVMKGSKVRYICNGQTYVTDTLTSDITVTQSSGSLVEEDEYSKYLFVHFTGSEGSANDEQIYFSVSEDALTWNVLNQGQPILKSTLGELGVRDPHIVRSPDGQKFYLIATDLSIYNHHDWNWAQYNASKKIMIWESTDLVNWSEQREVEIGVDGAGCVWAPESIWDHEKNAYMVFWASMVQLEGDSAAKQRIYRSYTTDFINFTEPEIYIERDNHVIDTTILEQDGVYYRYSKDETTKKVMLDYSTSLDGPWKSTNLAIANCEGPTAFKYNGENKWGLFVDSLGASWSGYGLHNTNDMLADSYAFTDTEQEIKLRHGTVIPITEEEYNNLIEKYPMTVVPDDDTNFNDVKYYFSEDTVASAGSVNNGDVKEWKITSTPEYFYIDKIDFDNLEKITIHSGHGGSNYTGTYKLYAYDNGGEAVTKEQLQGFKTDSSVLGTEIAKVSDSNDAWGYNTITINKTEVAQNQTGGNYTLDTANSSPLTIAEGTGTKALIMQVEYSNASPTAYFDYITLSYNADNIPPTRWDTYGDSFNGKKSDNAIVWHKFSNNSAGGSWNQSEDGIITIQSNEGTAPADVCYGITATIKNIQPETKYYITYKEKATLTEVTNTAHGFYLKPDTMSTTSANTDVATVTHAVTTRNNNNISLHNAACETADWVEKTIIWTSGTGIATEGDDVYAAKLEFTLRSAVGSVQIKDLIIFEEPEPGTLVVKSVTGEGIKQYSVIIDTVTRVITIPVYPGTDIGKLNPVLELDEGVTASLTAGTWAEGTLTLDKDGYTEDWAVKTVERANPLFDGYYADPNMVIFGDTYYIYPTTDGGTDWNSTSFKCFSSKDMVNWKDEGVILELSDVSWSTGVYGWAPTIAEKNGKYYFYFSSASKTSSAKQLGVAVADTPTGPFVATDAPIIPSDNGYTSGGQMIDPYVFIDDDGKAYIYWGNQQMYAAQLNDDMISVDWSTFVKITPSNFTEGTFVIKRNNQYYFMWSKNDTGSPAYQVRYGVSDSPLGPITGDTLILTQGNTNSSKIKGTGHHSVINIPGTDEWYICYHRFNIPLFGDATTQTSAAGNHREVCIDKMEFDEDGNIKTVLATLEGITEPVPITAVYKKGDLNADDAVTAVDALLNLQIMNSGETTAEQLKVGDMDEDEDIDIDDVQMILDIASGKE
ncbi:MAG: family 43 glycosylhydrolase [Lachnospiraceae bacterium]